MSLLNKGNLLGFMLLHLFCRLAEKGICTHISMAGRTLRFDRIDHIISTQLPNPEQDS